MDAVESRLRLELETGYPELVIAVGKITFGSHKRKEKSYTEMQTKELSEMKKGVPRKAKNANGEGKKVREEREKETLLLARAACALLNSGGGMIKAMIENKDYSYAQHGVGLDIEASFRDCVQSESYSQYFSFKQEGSDLLIWVKSWTAPNGNNPRICSIKTGLYRRFGESAVKVKPGEALNFLRAKQASAKKSSGEETMMSTPKRARLDNISSMNSAAVGLQSEDEMQMATAWFLEWEPLKWGAALTFRESEFAEFKAFPKDTLAFVRETLPRYVSAFANVKGGYLIFGVDDHGKIVGCGENVDPAEVERLVHGAIDHLPCFHFCTSQPKIDYEFKARAVCNEDGTGRGHVFVVRIKAFCCVCFSEEPDSWIVSAVNVKRLKASEWIPLMIAEDPDLSKLAEHFTKELSISGGPPMIKPVYSIQGLNSLDSLQKSLFPVSTRGVSCIPQALCSKLFSDYPGLKDLVANEIQTVAHGMLMFSRSWSVDVGLPKHQAILCDALLIAVGSHPLLLTIVKNFSMEIFQHATRTARVLKIKLVNVGGYAENICIIPKIVYWQPDANTWNPANQTLLYGNAYRLLAEHLPVLLRALTILLLSFTSFFSDSIGVEFLNLLTLEQYEEFSKKLDETRLQFIYGLPGSGKTIVALKIIEKITNEFDCRADEVLYICENKPLRDFVGKRIRNAVTRCTFMKEEFPNVKHIVVDEGQSFRVEHGNWYEKANKIVFREDSNGILWIFMDYFQLTHPYLTGLPPAAKQYPRAKLTIGVRNATEIYEIIEKEMKNIVENKHLNIPHKQLKQLVDEARCGHSMTGFCESQSMERSEIARYVAKMCKRYLEKDYSKKDIAILCSSREALEKYYRPLLQEMRKLRPHSSFVEANEMLDDEIVIDSVRRFSGLERPIVFGINPVPNPAQAEVKHNLLLCMASRANRRLHLLYEVQKPDLG